MVDIYRAAKRPSTVPEYSSRQAVMRKHLFFQVLTPVFGKKSARVWLQCLELNGTWLLVVLSV